MSSILDDTRVHIEAIVIRKRPIREYDQWVVLYSRELGKISALAKGSLRFHSRQALSLDEGSTMQCELIEGRSSPIMTGTQALRSLSNAKRDPRVWAAVQVFLQAVDTVVFDAQPDSTLWECLVGILSELEAATPESVLVVYRRGQGQLLEALGYGHQGEQERSLRWVRTALDEQFEVIAQRRLSSIDLLYDVAGMTSS